MLSSGDGGCIHLAPHIAELLASRGWLVVGVDSRDSARQPKALWTIPAGNHRFSDNLNVFDARLVEALTWIESAALR